MLKAGGVCRNSEHRSRQELHAYTTGLHSRDVGVNAVQFRLNWSLRTLSGSWQSTQRGMGLSSIWMCRYNMLLGILSFSQRWKPYFHSAEWNSNFGQKFIVRKDTRQGRDPEIKVPLKFATGRIDLHHMQDFIWKTCNVCSLLQSYWPKVQVLLFSQLYLCNTQVVSSSHHF